MINKYGIYIIWSLNSGRHNSYICNEWLDMKSGWKLRNDICLFLKQDLDLTVL